MGIFSEIASLVKNLYVWKTTLCVINDNIVEKILNYAQFKIVCVVIGHKNMKVKQLPRVAKVI